MALIAISLLCFAALLPFPGLGLLADSGEPEQFPISVIVMNDINPTPPVTYSTNMTEGEVMFGVLNHLQDSHTGFKFRYIVYKTVGLYLESVNGVAGSVKDKTYWQLLSQKGHDTPLPLKVGIGCYQPQKDETLILEFTSYAPKKDLVNDEL